MPVVKDREAWIAAVHEVADTNPTERLNNKCQPWLIASTPLFALFFKSYLSVCLFIYFLLSWVFIDTHGLLLAVWAFSRWGEWGLLSSCGGHAPGFTGFSCCRAGALEHAGFSRCTKWAQELQLMGPEACGILVPGPGIKPMSTALAGKFLTTDH